MIITFQNGKEFKRYVDANQLIIRFLDGFGVSLLIAKTAADEVKAIFAVKTRN